MLDLIAITRELREELPNAKIDNVYRAENGLLFKLSTSKGKAYLIANKHRVSTTKYIHAKSSEGLATLRNLVRGRTVADLFMPRFDRILTIKLAGSAEVFFELLEPFNVIVVEEGSIKWLLHPYRGRDRTLTVGRTYSPPPANFVNPLEAEPGEVRRVIEEGNLVRSLAKSLGLGRELAAEVVARAQSSRAEDLLRVIRGLVEEVKSGVLSPYICYSGGIPLTVLPIRFISVECAEERRFDSFCDAVDEYFKEVELEEAVKSRRKEVEAEIERLKRSVEELERKIAEYRDRAGRLRAIASLLLNRKYVVGELLEAVRELYRERKEDAARQAVGLRREDVVIVGLDPASKKVVVEVGGEKIAFKLLESVGEVIKRLFEEAKELERKARRAEEAREDMRGKIEELEAKGVELAARVEVKEVRAREWFERFHWFITSGGVPTIGGRDASQNEAIVRRYLKPNYLFFHADIPGASVVVAKPITSEDDAKEIAYFAASFSRAWKLGLQSVDVYYVRGEQVSKEAPAGQYLAKGSFMVYGPRTWIRGVRLELGVGVREDEGVERVVTAPRIAIGKLAERYVVLVPGSVEKSKVAKEIQKSLGANVDLEDIVREIPGPSKRVEVGRGTPIPWTKIKEVFSSW